MIRFSDYSDEELVILLKQDDESAFNELYNRLWKNLYIKALNFLKSDSDAQDCVQNVFTSLWKNRHKSLPQKVNNYMHQAVRFQIFNIINEKKAIVGLDEKINEFTKVVLNGNDIQYKELKIALENLISKLPLENQEIFLLNREMGLTYKEIAKIKNISIKTVEKKMSQVLSFLRHHWTSSFMLYMIIHFTN